MVKHMAYNELTPGCNGLNADNILSPPGIANNLDAV